jgi:hypothetical protein
MPVPALADILENRRWEFRSEPFPHVAAGSVFTEPFYQKLEAALYRILDRGVSDSPTADKLSRNIPGYDAYGLSLQDSSCAEFQVFQSWPWHNMLARLFHISATGHVNCGLHHHRPGSQDGWVHNDLNPAWFVAGVPREEIVLAQHELCSYTHGITKSPDIKAVEVVRAVAVIYYFGNGCWREDEGGTGLYKTWDQPVRQPDAVIAPVDNSILIFECTPFSFHSFIGGNRRARNSVIMWLHRPKDEVVRRWGEKSIRGWPGEDAIFP